MLHRSHIQFTVKSDLCIELVPEEQWAATARHRGPTPDCESVPRSRVRTGDRPNIHTFGGGRNQSTQRKPTQTHGQHANSTQTGPAAAVNSTQDLLYHEMTELTTESPCRPNMNMHVSIFKTSHCHTSCGSIVLTKQNKLISVHRRLSDSLCVYVGGSCSKCKNLRESVTNNYTSWSSDNKNLLVYQGLHLSWL